MRWTCKPTHSAIPNFLALKKTRDYNSRDMKKSARWHSDLLRTKLAMPPPRQDTILRARLLARLDNALLAKHKLALISAPPGFGKTTLVTTWLQTKNDRSQNGAIHPSSFILHPSPVWLALDAADNDPTRFWLYLVGALDNATNAQTGWDEIVPLLQAPTPPPLEHIVALVLNVCAQLALAPNAPLVIVLEDYHLIQNAELHRALTYWLDHVPPHMLLVLTSRADPALPLARLRARGQLTELRAADLRFRPDEANALVQQTLRAPLTPTQIALLEQRTEGWAAGLQLAALALASQPMQDANKTQQFIDAFAGNHRFIMDYLVEEVFARESETIQNFLLQTSILERLSAPLCQAMLQTKDLAPDLNSNSQSLTSTLQSFLEQLERRNLFIHALDEQREWFRYHPLFAQVLVHHLQQQDATKIPLLRSRASAWFEQQGLYVEAIQYALAAHAYSDAARLIQATGADTLARGEHVTLTKWLDAFPETEMLKHPALFLTRGFIANFQQDNAQAARHLASAERAAELYVTNETEKKHLAGQAAALRAFIALYQNELESALCTADTALENLPDTDARLRTRVLIQKGSALTWQNKLAEGLTLFQQAKALAAETDDILNLLWAEYNHCSSLLGIGEFPQAYNALQNILTFAREQRREENVFVQLMYADLSEICYEWNELARALEYADQAETFARQFQLPRLQNIAQTNIQRALYAQGEHARARELLTQTLADIERLQLPVRYAYMSLAMRGEWLLLETAPRAAREWIHAHGITADTPYHYIREPELFVLARAHIELQEDAAAQSIAQTISHAAAQMQRPLGTLRAEILYALLAARRSDNTARRAALTNALAIAAPRRIARVWLDMGIQIFDLLNDLPAESVSPAHTAFLKELLSAFALPLHTTRTPAVSPLLEPLTEREVEVLELVAKGSSDKEIAQTLILATGTVKRHLNNIYGKLGVNSRTQALARARENGLLE